MLVGERLIGPLYRHGSTGADIAVIEGVMGLFDGRISDDSAGTAQGSTAHVAELLGAPVILVVDARGQSHSIAALLHGFSTFDQSVRIAGVILNRVGSPRHEEVLRQACEHAGVPVFGAIPRADELSVPSRHLGLVTAAEHGEQARAAVEAMTELVGRHVDVAGIAAVAASRVTDEPWDPAVAAPTDRERHGRTGCGQGVQLRLYRTRRASARRRRRCRRVRPIGRPAAATDRRAGASRRLPRAVQHRPVDQ